ncbi:MULTISPECIES: hypothetical protein [unclassified Rhizobium]|uniref:hypothetical protein n=1 Tax=unclassified Rhizobium TaxID=2613769 RepID=UPI00138F4CC9|nr:MULTISPECIES: hypothetical protein [unclassified Rhizobium]
MSKMRIRLIRDETFAFISTMSVTPVGRLFDAPFQKSRLEPAANKLGSIGRKNMAVQQKSFRLFTAAQHFNRKILWDFRTDPFIPDRKIPRFKGLEAIAKIR